MAKVWSYWVMVTQARWGAVADVKACESVDRQGRHDLTHPVAAIIEEEDAVAFPHRADRYPFPHMDQRMDELVRLTPLVGGLHRKHRVFHRSPYTAHHGIICQLGAFPPPVPVHSIVAAGEGGDVHLAARDASHVHQEGSNHLRAQGWG
jgi:hypothetical protein